MATKQKETIVKQESKFNSEQLLASEKYANRRDVILAVDTDNFEGTLAEWDDRIENFMKGKVN